ncbi:MAG: c-type cytochrome [Chloroflexota bacterium]|nr:c-type cytochrome [Chloroflexota bacterium]
MNTSKQVNIMVLLIFASVIATAAYTIWDPHRSSEAKTVQTEKQVTYGAFLFSQNCIACHGNKGEGGSAANRLKQAPPLNRPDLQGVDPKTGQVSKNLRDQAFKLVVNTITCGRVGKAMPTWGQSQGGTLTDQQMSQLATLITQGTAWDQVDEFAVRGEEKYHINGYAVDGFRLAEALDGSSTTVKLNKIEGLDKGVRLEIDEPGPKDTKMPEIMLITGKPNKDDNSVVVERGVGTTNPVAHEAGAEVLKPPVPPDPPTIVQSACGQTAPAASPTQTGPSTPAADLTVIGQGTAFDKTELLGIAGQELTITFDNRDSGIAHNIHFFKGADATAPDGGSTEIAAGPVVQTLKLDPLDPGDYYYQCDVHPGQMEGKLTTVAAGAATPAAGATPDAASAGGPAAQPSSGGTQTAQTPAAANPTAGAATPTP